MQTPLDVSKLLDQLSGSTAWKEALESQTKTRQPVRNASASASRDPRTRTRPIVEENKSSHVADTHDLSKEAETTTSASDKVQELLKLLGTNDSRPADSEDSAMRDASSTETISRTQTPSNSLPGAATSLTSREGLPKGRERNLKDMPFVDALEEISRLAKKPQVIKHLAEVLIYFASVIYGISTSNVYMLYDSALSTNCLPTLSNLLDKR